MQSINTGNKCLTPLVTRRMKVSTASLLHHIPVRIALEKTMPTDDLSRRQPSPHGSPNFQRAPRKRQFSTVSTPRELVIFLLKFIPVPNLGGKKC